MKQAASGKKDVRFEFAERLSNSKQRLENQLQRLADAYTAAADDEGRQRAWEQMQDSFRQMQRQQQQATEEAPLLGCQDDFMQFTQLQFEACLAEALKGTQAEHFSNDIKGLGSVMAQVLLHYVVGPQTLRVLALSGQLTACYGTGYSALAFLLQHGLADGPLKVLKPVMQAVLAEHAQQEARTADLMQQIQQLERTRARQESEAEAALKAHQFAGLGGGRGGGRGGRGGAPGPGQASPKSAGGAAAYVAAKEAQDAAAAKLKAAKAELASLKQSTGPARALLDEMIATMEPALVEAAAAYGNVDIMFATVLTLLQAVPPKHDDHSAKTRPAAAPSKASSHATAQGSSSATKAGTASAKPSSSKQGGSSKPRNSRGGSAMASSGGGLGDSGNMAGSLLQQQQRWKSQGLQYGINTGADVHWSGVRRGSLSTGQIAMLEKAGVVLKAAQLQEALPPSFVVVLLAVLRHNLATQPKFAAKVQADYQKAVKKQQQQQQQQAPTQVPALEGEALVEYALRSTMSCWANILAACATRALCATVQAVTSWLGVDGLLRQPVALSVLVRFMFGKAAADKASVEQWRKYQENLIAYYKLVDGLVSALGLSVHKLPLQQLAAFMVEQLTAGTAELAEGPGTPGVISSYQLLAGMLVLPHSIYTHYEAGLFMCQLFTNKQSLAVAASRAALEQRGSSSRTGALMQKPVQRRVQKLLDAATSVVVKVEEQVAARDTQQKQQQGQQGQQQAAPGGQQGSWLQLMQQQQQAKQQQQTQEGVGTPSQQRTVATAKERLLAVQKGCAEIVKVMQAGSVSGKGGLCDEWGTRMLVQQYERKQAQAATAGNTPAATAPAAASNKRLLLERMQPQERPKRDRQDSMKKRLSMESARFEQEQASSSQKTPQRHKPAAKAAAAAAAAGQAPGAGERQEQEQPVSDTSTAADRSRRKSQLPSRFRDAGEAPTQQQQSSNKTPQPRKPAAAGEAPGVGHGEQQEQALVSDTGGSADRGPGMPLSLGVAEAGGEKQQAPSNKLTPGSRSWAAVAAGKAGQAPPDLHAAGGSSSARAQQQRGGLRSQMSGGAAAAALEQQQPSSSQKPPLPRVHPAPAAAAAAAAAAGAGSSGPRSALPKADASVEQLKIFMDAVAGSTDADVLMCTTKAGEVLTSLQLPVLGVEDLGRMTAAVQEAAAEAGAALLLDGTEGDPISGASAVTAHTHLAFVHGVRTGCFISPFDSYEAVGTETNSGDGVGMRVSLSPQEAHHNQPARGWVQRAREQLALEGDSEGLAEVVTTTTSRPPPNPLLLMSGKVLASATEAAQLMGPLRDTLRAVFDGELVEGMGLESRATGAPGALYVLSALRLLHKLQPALLAWVAADETPLQLPGDSDSSSVEAVLDLLRTAAMQDAMCCLPNVVGRVLQLVWLLLDTAWQVADKEARLLAMWQQGLGEELPTAKYGDQAAAAQQLVQQVKQLQAAVSEVQDKIAEQPLLALLEPAAPEVHALLVTELRELQVQPVPLGPAGQLQQLAQRLSQVDGQMAVGVARLLRDAASHNVWVEVGLG